MVEEPPAVPPSRPSRRKPAAAASVAREAAVELELKGVLVRVRPGADARTLAMVVRTLKGSA